MQTTSSRRRGLIAAAAAAAALLIGAGLYLFQPWKLLVDETVDEALPSAGATAGTGDSPAPAASTAPSPPAEPVVLSSGSFISHEHPTTGTVQILTLADGSRVLRIEDLATSNGPDLKVWLTDAPVIEGRDGWGVFDDGIWLDLGPLKGNVGSQNYAIPADAQLGQYSSVSIWCDRFNVSFGAAELAPA